MIMARNEDGTYSQVGFVKDNAGIDTEYIYDKDDDIVFEKGFTRETSGTVPLTINGIEKDLKAWSITGNTVQNGTPTPENPVEVVGVGDRTGNLFDPNSTRYHMGKDANNKIGIVAYGAMFYIEAAPNTNYTIKAYTTDSTFVRLYLSNAPIVDGVAESYNVISESETTINPEVTISNTNYTYLWIQTGGTWYTEHGGSSIMLNSGSTALPYEPYGYKIPVVTSADGTEPITTPIYLPTPLYSGEVMRSDGSREVKLGKLVLTGEEEITTHKTFEDGTISIRIPSSKAKANGIIYCTHLQNVSFAEIYNNEKQGISTHLKNELNNLYCLISGFTKLTQYKDFFRNEYSAGTPVTVWYQLAEPTTETFTVPKIPTISGTTIIDVDTKVKPTEMYIKYKSSK